MSKRPLSLVVAAIVVALEGLVALGLGLFVGVETARGDAENLTAALAEAAFGMLIGAGLLWVAWGGLLRMERWGRSPGVLAQIFLLPVAWTLIQADQLLLGIPVIVAALIGLVALLAPPTTHALYGED
ncbi:hypothetical protein [Nonomuraea cavernae]|uniref:Integral membrane protein n=1 Tax=Nonomuraea cavernae TaxID=2045107 RepID=A0A918DFX5_9ACTN|nr:hypothetical protein [Nonomuraea cavernae]MCA2184820.1 hypothetical protein [Nonomuraea cavernae]GGO64559.1 hypothetical protein GCM10012289_14170 [Nonomuraea cavernae]